MLGIEQYKYEKDIGEIVDEIINILSYDTWVQVGAFMEDPHAAMHLPLEDDMWWQLDNRHSIVAKILQGKDCKIIATGSGNTLQEAVCRTWLEWKRSES